jgi:hypothetical protein
MMGAPTEVEHQHVIDEHEHQRVQEDVEGVGPALRQVDAEHHEELCGHGGAERGELEERRRYKSASEEGDSDVTNERIMH